MALALTSPPPSRVVARRHRPPRPVDGPTAQLVESDRHHRPRAARHRPAPLHRAGSRARPVSTRPRVHQATTVLTKQIATLLDRADRLHQIAALVTDADRVALADGRTAERTLRRRVADDRRDRRGPLRRRARRRERLRRAGHRATRRHPSGATERRLVGHQWLDRTGRALGHDHRRPRQSDARAAEGT